MRLIAMSIALALVLCSPVWAEGIMRSEDEFTGTVYWEYTYDDWGALMSADIATGLIIAQNEAWGTFLGLDLYACHEDWLFPETAWIVGVNAAGQKSRLQIDVSRYGFQTLKYDTDVLSGGIVTEDIRLVLAGSSDPQLTIWPDSMLEEVLGWEELNVRIDGEYEATDVFVDLDAWQALIEKYKELR